MHIRIKPYHFGYGIALYYLTNTRYFVMSIEKRVFQCGTKKLSESFYSLGSFSFSTKNFEPKLTSFDLIKKTRGVNQYESSLEALELSYKNQKKYQLQIRTVQNDLDRVLAEYKTIKDRF